MKRQHPLYLLSIGPVAGVSTLFLETAHLSGLLQEIGLDYLYVELSSDPCETEPLDALAKTIPGSAVILLEARFEHYPVVKKIVAALDSATAAGNIVVWGSMADPEYSDSLCPFLSGCTKIGDGIVGVARHLLALKTNLLPSAPQFNDKKHHHFNTPDYQSFPIATYVARYQSSQRYWNIRGSSGCYGSCAYCSRAGKRFLQRDIECLLGEIVWLNRNYGIERFSFIDDNYLHSSKRVETISQAFGTLDFPIRYRFQGRIDRLDENLLEEMQASGLRGISLGLESGNERILSSLNKNLTIEAIRKGLTLLNRLDIPFHGTFIIGAPLETEATVEDTARLISDFFNGNYTICFLKPLPGTDIYRHAVITGRIASEVNYCERLVADYRTPLVNLTDYDGNTLLQWKERLESL